MKFNELINISVLEETLGFVKSLILSSSAGKYQYKKEYFEILNKTVKESEMILYRGISFLYSKTDKENYIELLHKKEGDIISEKFFKNSNYILHYSKSQRTAKQYAKGGLEVVIQSRVNKNSILCDLGNIEKTFDKNILSRFFDEDDLKYMKKEKEVFVLNENIEGEIVFIKRTDKFDSIALSLHRKGLL